MPNWTTSATSLYTSGTIANNNLYTTVSYLDREEKFKEYTEKVDRHVDQLEEDIEFLNNEREQLKLDIARLEHGLYLANEQIKSLEADREFLKGFTNYLEDRISKLEENK